MGDVEESIDQYYDESLEESKQSNKKDDSLELMKKKLEKMRNNENNEESEHDSSPKSSKSDKDQKDNADRYQLDSYDESVNSKKIDQISGDMSEILDEELKFEVESNSFSNNSKQSMKDIKIEDEDNKAYTIKKDAQLSDSKQSEKDLKISKVNVQVATPNANKGSATAIKRISSAKPVTSKPQNQNINTNNLIKTPNVVSEKQKLTQHKAEQLKKKKEIEDEEKKLQKKAKLPDIQSKALKVNNFVKDPKDEKRIKAADQKIAGPAKKLIPLEQKQKHVKTNLEEKKKKIDNEEEIFGENEMEKGDQAAAPVEDSEEVKKLKEKQRKQEIMKEQQRARKNQEENQKENIAQILKKHKEKQEELKEREDDLYVREAVEKIQQKRVKQNIQFEKEESNWVDITRKDQTGQDKEQIEKDQEKLRINAINNLKLEEEMLRKKKNKPGQEIQTKIQEAKEQKWDGNIAQKKPTKNEQSKIESEKSDVQRENGMILEMKQRERKKYLEQLEVEKQLKQKANEFVREGQDNLKKENRAFDNIDRILNEKKGQKPEKQKERNVQYEEEQKEKGEQDAIEIKKLKLQLKQLAQEGNKIKQALEKQKETIQKNKDHILKIKNREGVVVLGENKFTSFGLVPVLNKAQNKKLDVSTADEESLNLLDKINDQEKRYMTQPTVIELIVNKITGQGLSLSDKIDMMQQNEQIFSLLDFNKDGILTIQEIEQNMVKLDLDLAKEEIQEMIKIIDSNKDGVINEYEFVKNLESQYQAEKEYNRLMGDLQEIQNPIALQERILDLEVRQRVVLKCTKNEQEKQLAKDPDYEKYLVKLKKQEEAYEKRQKLRKKGQDLTELTKKAEMYKIQLKNLEDDKEKELLMQRERMEAISSNIQKLTEELVSLSEITIKAKNYVDKESNDYQKLVLKQVAIDRLQEQVDRQRQMKEKEQQKQAGVFQSNIRQKAINVQFEQQQRMSVQNTVGAVIMLQKIYRGWKSRIQARKNKEKMVRAAKFISAFYWWFSKKFKARKVNHLLKELLRRRYLIAFKLFQVIYYQSKNKLAPASLMVALRKILSSEEYNYFVSKQSEIKLNLQKQSRKKQGPEDANMFGEEERDSGVNSSQQQSNLPEYEKASKRKAAILNQEFQLNELPAVMTLQRGYRNWRKRIGFNEDSVITFSMGNFSPICKFCNEKKVEVICRSCEQCIFCQTCFDRFHKSYHRKNHHFYELNPEHNKTEQFSDKKILEYKEDIFKAIQFQFNDMKKFFSQVDQNTGLVPFNTVYEYFEKIQTLQNNKDLLGKAKQLISRFISAGTEALGRFKAQNIEQKYDPQKQYVDQDKFIRGFAKYTSQS